MSWIRDKIDKFILSRVVSRVVIYLKENTWAVGAVSFLLWVAIYAMPAFSPDYNWITHYASIIRDTLKAGGVDLDNELFNAGAGFTLVGLVTRVKKLIKTYREKNKNGS